MRLVLERHGGRVEKYIGDAIMAVFGLPRLHEDDAVRAVRAAFEMKERLVDVNEMLFERFGVRLENRTGVNTGEVVAGDVSSGQRLVTGDTVNTAARLEQNAPTMEILIGGVDVPAGARRRDRRAGRAAATQGQGRAGPRVPADRRVGPGRRVLAPPRPADRRARGGARDPARGVPSVGGAEPVPHRDGLRPGRGGQVPPPQGVPRTGERRRRHAEGTLPLVRRRRHVLADRRDRSCGRRDRGRRRLGGGSGQARRDAPRPRGRDPTRRVGDRADRGVVLGGGDVLGGQARTGDLGGTTPLVLLVDDIHWAERTLLGPPPFRGGGMSGAGAAAVLVPPRAARGTPGVGRGHATGSARSRSSRSGRTRALA